MLKISIYISVDFDEQNSTKRKKKKERNETKREVTEEKKEAQLSICDRWPIDKTGENK